ncbi:MAG: polysaccharide deacetylase family protein [Patescibacteria group bacterium]|nr:polysaccharide deacetylase family protein [Patescibacteria group bacterium]
MKVNKVKLFLVFALVVLLIIIFSSLLFYQKYNADQKQNNDKQNSSTELKDEIEKEKKQLPKINNTTFNIPIYMYHHIQDTDPDGDQLLYGLSLSISSFQEQMNYLKNNNYKTLTLTEMLDHPLAKSVVLTFDDGYIDIYQKAYPIMQKVGYRGVIFVITDLVSTPGYMSWEELKELKNAGWEMGSHTLSHPSLETLDFDSATNQIASSKKIIEKTLQTKVNFFCYPAGKYNQETIKILKSADYIGAVTTQYGLENSRNNIFELERIRINGGASLNDFTAPI